MLQARQEEADDVRRRAEDERALKAAEFARTRTEARAKRESQVRHGVNASYL